ncbi:MAG TPA: hypothetical protein VGF28_18335 [Thermoanaerobaculia bacterium]|jgi:hypothetical protein
MRDVGPFEAHIREALELNRERAAWYASLTNGASNVVFRRYLLAERAVLPAAAWFDRRSAPYHSAGVPLLSSVFVSMQTVPALTGAAAPRTGDGTAPNVRRIVRALRSAFRAGGFDGLARAADESVQALAERPWRDCMLRHQLESLRRLGNASPRNVSHAVELGLPSPERLLRRFVQFHLQGVRFAPWIDKPALRLQLRGVPILENDLPHIPAWPEGWLR